ncbi:hypothetical protein KC332_g16740 [Hortaea werneckii]|uniref:Uncharacterized protein n=2 Tax=Hortaea werneckii TaxID=91943 RepID=A0A3M7IA56_HORWE|nr:hypothetical protein KC350_g18271 [Hortaea werneckii]OTA25306.1 hypothetical protein BTJ68_10466 [Hortaea werneckii EXF-2000]KAI6817814.1 hypothetical protein KC358_g10171 [Hortaea werneckii]KAI6909212.1 hypothetical protein KC348_g13566 [Hortaea werneckii]KAI6939079.1 hypothetical protein KC341_g4429 [Hortaea werneckii]
MSMNAAVGHLARRGLHHAQVHFAQPPPSQDGAAAFEQHDTPKMDIKPGEMLPILITGFITLLIIASVRYTVGEVMASLAMIESPSTTAIIEPASKDDLPPPAYSEEAYADEPNAPRKDEKEGLLPSEAMARDQPAQPADNEDVEITVIDHKPVTASIRSTIGLLHSVGGFRARWRGLGASILYHALHGFVTNLLASFLGFGLIGNALCYIFTSLALMRVHMLWTHSMIAHPTNKSLFARFVPRKQCRVLLLPTLVHAVAQQATFILPLAVAIAMGLGPDMMAAHPHGHPDSISDDPSPHKQGCAMMLNLLRLLAVPTTALFVALAVLLPASVTLTRLEATLLPEDETTLVPFDREAIVSEDINPSVRGASRALFVQAWRSFDSAARLRLVKLYVKMVMAQLAVAFVGFHVVLAEIYLIGGERIGEFVKALGEVVREAQKSEGGVPQ